MSLFYALIYICTHNILYFFDDQKLRKKFCNRYICHPVQPAPCLLHQKWKWHIYHLHHPAFMFATRIASLTHLAHRHCVICPVVSLLSYFPLLEFVTEINVSFLFRSTLSPLLIGDWLGSNYTATCKVCITSVHKRQKIACQMT